MDRPGYEADRFHLVAYDLAAGTARNVAPKWDRSVDELELSADGAFAIVTADQLGKKPLFRIDLAKGDVVQLAERGSISGAVPFGKEVAFFADGLVAPAELHKTVLDPPGGTTRITGINDERVAAARMGEPEQFEFKGAGGDTVYGWVVKPVDFDATKTYPIAFLIHGGPQGSFGDHFHYRWNPQAYAGGGYGVVMIDFHGSTGYGQKFTDSIRDDWGGKPLVDLQKGLAAAVANYPWLDPKRACALGASYGGFMINWIAGKWPDGFRCLVNHDGLFDQRAMYYSTEELWFPEWESKGPHFLVPKNYEKWNPVAHVTKWKTPMLVVHGSLDYRVPDTQGISTFTALQRRGIESRLLAFPDENHWVLKPANSLLWHDTVLAWLDKYVGQAK
jgi:dipeptidyl aminopeptidase/acylaminoacyl peptidase